VTAFGNTALFRITIKTLLESSFLKIIKVMKDMAEALFEEL
jgi:hypothetical protein